MDFPQSVPSFRVSTTVPVALVTDPTVATDHFLVSSFDKDPGLAAVSRISTREDGDLRDALVKMVNTIASLKSEVAALSNELRLNQSGVRLEPKVVEIGPTGMSIEAPHLRVSERLRVVVSLVVRGVRQLLVLDAVAVAQGDQADIRFVALTATAEAALVAFSFEQQGRARVVTLDSHYC